MNKKVEVLNDALSAHLLGVIRNKESKINEFRSALERLSYILVTEALKNFPLETYELETPLEKVKAQRLAHSIVIVPILRAGLSMLSSFMYFLPDAQVGFIGQKRDEETAKAFEYYRNFPELKNKKIIIIDPMLATGGSAVATIESLIEKGAKEEDIQLVCVISAPEGIEHLHKHFPKVAILSAATDRCLNDKKYILPGLGDAGDLWTGSCGN